jgi:hypothetical protein
METKTQAKPTTDEKATALLKRKKFRVKNCVRK